MPETSREFGEQKTRCSPVWLRQSIYWPRCVAQAGVPLEHVSSWQRRRVLMTKCVTKRGDWLRNLGPVCRGRGTSMSSDLYGIAGKKREPNSAGTAGIRSYTEYALYVHAASYRWQLSLPFVLL